MASVVITSFVIAALYLGREILIPMALAALLAFLLTPIVARLERWIGRVAATLTAVAILFGVIGGVGWVLTRQMIDLATQLPDYKQNIQTKLKSLKMPGSGRFTAFNKTVEELRKDLPGADASPGATADTTTTVPVPQKGVPGQPKMPPNAGPPTPVEVVQTTRVGPMEQLGMVLGSLAGPSGTAALVLLLLFCMLLQREDLVGRIIRLVGFGNISATTRGIADAAKRVSRYLLMQLIVNASYGLVVAVGLYYIGVPSAFVWGVLATVLRFIPYVGAWIASGFPIALSLAVSTSWTMPVLTIALFLVVELISNNVMEPMLYGSSTGVSSIALIIAAVFWTWIWGPPGLILATPLTVCLVVIGRHVPRLSILSVLLSDDEALAPQDELYHRLLAPNTTAASDFSLNWLKTHSRTALYDAVFIPTLATVEVDRVSGQLETEQHARLLQELRDMVEDIGQRPVVPSKLEADKAVAVADASAPPALPAPTCRVMCLPVRVDRDEIAGLMLTQLLQQADFSASCLTAKMTSSESPEQVAKDGADAVCISVAPPSTVVHARLSLRQTARAISEAEHRRRPVGRDREFDGCHQPPARSRRRRSGHDAGRRRAALLQVRWHAGPRDRADADAIQRNRTPGRTAGVEFARYRNRSGVREHHQKLTHVLNMPIALITFVDADRQFLKSSRGLPQDLAEARQTPRDVSVCSHVVAANEVLVFEDLARDHRFANNRLLKERGLRFYAGAPLRGKNDLVLGSVCVLDHRPRQFSEHEKRFLQTMAEEVMEIVNERFVAPTDYPNAAAMMT